MTKNTILLHYSQISPSPLNHLIRGPIDDNAPDIQELSESIARLGIIQPLVVTETPDGPTPYQLLVGERRLRATRLLGDKAPLLPCQVKEPMTYLETLIYMGVENLQRENLPPVTEARYYQALQDEGLDVPAIARRTGKLIGHIQRRLELLELALPVQEHINSGRIVMQAKKYLIKLPHALQIQVADKMVGKNGKAIEQAVSQALKGKRLKKPKTVPNLTFEPTELQAYLWELASQTLCEGCRLEGLKGKCRACPGAMEFIDHLLDRAEPRATDPVNFDLGLQECLDVKPY